MRGRGRRPLAPVHLKAWRGGGSDDVTLSWVRRTRLGGDGWDGSDVPLGEEREAYAVEILSGGAVVREVAAEAAPVTYTAAQQEADFGAAVTSLDWRVSQLSASFGRGVPAAATHHL